MFAANTDHKKTAKKMSSVIRHKHDAATCRKVLGSDKALRLLETFPLRGQADH